MYQNVDARCATIIKSYLKGEFELHHTSGVGSVDNLPRGDFVKLVHTLQGQLESSMAQRNQSRVSYPTPSSCTRGATSAQPSPRSPCELMQKARRRDRQASNDGVNRRNREFERSKYGASATLAVSAAMTTLPPATFAAVRALPAVAGSDPRYQFGAGTGAHAVDAARVGAVGTGYHAGGAGGGAGAGVGGLMDRTVRTPARSNKRLTPTATASSSSGSASTPRKRARSAYASTKA